MHKYKSLSFYICIHIVVDATETEKFFSVFSRSLSVPFGGVFTSHSHSHLTLSLSVSLGRSFSVSFDAAVVVIVRLL